MVSLGNYIFAHRNIIFPLFFVVLVLGTSPGQESQHLEVWRYAIGITVALSGQIIRALTIGLAYITRGGRKGKVYAKALVKDGVFAHCRNPLYLGNILIVIGLGIVAHSIPFYVVGIPLFLFMYLAIIKAEEHYLAGKFGEEYAAYCRAVPRLVPNMSGSSKTIQGMTFNWRRLIVKEYGTTYTWILCMMLLVVKNQYLQHNREITKTAMLIFFLVIPVTSLYAVAWYLKKTRRLTAEG
jgi:protein-S-isoprenylcysteine O-methyltransferase Ste14